MKQTEWKKELKSDPLLADRYRECGELILNCMENFFNVLKEYALKYWIFLKYLHQGGIVDILSANSENKIPNLKFFFITFQ